MTDEQFKLIKAKGVEDFQAYPIDLMTEEEIFYWSERVVLEAAYSAGFEKSARLESKSKRTEL